MNKLEVGQVIWTLNVGNAARRCGQELTERVITKVGRKYFYIEVFRRKVKFEIETLEECSDYTSDYKVYINKQDYFNEIKKRELLTGIRGILTPQFGVSKVSLDTVISVAKILGLDVEEND